MTNIQRLLDAGLQLVAMRRLLAEADYERTVREATLAAEVNGRNEQERKYALIALCAADASWTTLHEATAQYSVHLAEVYVEHWRAQVQLDRASLRHECG